MSRYLAIKQNGEETRFLIDKNQQEYAQVIEEYQANGTVQNTYVHGIDLISKEDTNGRTYYQVDGLGSTHLLTDNNGAIVVEYDYDAYGNLTRKVGDASNNYLFAGEQFDEAIDEYYLRARYYNPATGRFVSGDPFEGYLNQPVTLHDYLYAGNNPANSIDPSGLSVLGELLKVLSLASAILFGINEGIDLYDERFLAFAKTACKLKEDTLFPEISTTNDGHIIYTTPVFLESIIIKKFRYSGETQPGGIKLSGYTSDIPINDDVSCRWGVTNFPLL